MPNQNYKETPEQFAERKRGYSQAWRNRQLAQGLTTEGKPRQVTTFHGEAGQERFEKQLREALERFSTRGEIASDLGIHPDAVTRRLRAKGPAELHTRWLSIKAVQR